MEELIKLVQSEKTALDALKQRLKAVENTRVPTLVLAGDGSMEDRLDFILRKLAQDVNGMHCDLRSSEVIKRLKNGSPLYGRTVTKHLSAAAMRQFLLRELSMSQARTLTVYMPAMIWKHMSTVHPNEPLLFLKGLFEWTSPCNLILSYPWGVDPSIPSLREIPDLPAHHIVELALTDAERRYLEGEWEETLHDRR
jgi:hypothetical protein